jgi:hypothetical protein
MPTTSSGRWLAGMAIGVAALAITAVIVTLAASSGDPTSLPAGSPEARVQDFVLAIDDGEIDLAYGMLAPVISDNCSALDFRRFVDTGRSSDLRVELDNVDLIGDDAIVNVKVTSFSGSPPFDFSENQYNARFSLSKIDGAWVVMEAPWPFSGCPPPPLKPAPTPTATPDATLEPKPAEA